MLNSAGKKIAFWSTVLLYLGIGVSLVVGLLLIWRGAQSHMVRYSLYYMGDLCAASFVSGGRAVIAGFLVIIIGSLVSWLWALLLRAFGDLVEDTRAIRERLEWAPAEMKAEETAAAKGEEPAKAEAKTPAKPRTRRPAKPKAEKPAEEDAGNNADA